MFNDLFLSTIDDRITNRLDGLIRLAKLLQINGLTDMHMHRMPMHERFTFRQYLKTSVQRERYDRQTEIPRYLERPAFEASYFAV